MNVYDWGAQQMKSHPSPILFNSPLKLPNPCESQVEMALLKPNHSCAQLSKDQTLCDFHRLFFAFTTVAKKKNIKQNPSLHTAMYIRLKRQGKGP